MSTNNLDFIRQYLPLIIPLLVLQLALMVVALRDLARREKTKGPKWLWAVVIVLGELIGPVIYFLVGREEE
jgi:bacteriorhodopsin